jgi:hypothetical protein
LRCGGCGGAVVGCGGVLVLAGLVGLAPAVWGQGSSLVRPLAQVETGPERGAWVTHVLLAPTVLSDEAFDTVSATADAVGGMRRRSGGGRGRMCL